MKLNQLITEANVAQKILKDPKMSKMLSIAVRHDGTLPKSRLAKLGPRPSDKEVVEMWSELIDEILSNNQYGDLSADGRFDDWLTRMYINGTADYEDISGEGGDALGVWKALSIRSKLKPADQDFNKFKNIKQLQRIRNDRQYKDELERIKNAEHIEKMKREAKEVVLIDNEKYRVIAPMNYGSCYTADKSGGYIPNFCTGSSSGASWFERYSPEGMIINVIDKENIEDVEGKWQFHAATNQLVRGDQENRHDLRRNDNKFATQFPGLMRDIVSAIQAKAPEIEQASMGIVTGGYDVAEEIQKIISKYPASMASKRDDQEEPAQEIDQVPEPTPEPEPEPQPEPEAEPEAPATRTFRVTQIASGRSANIEASDLAHVQQRVLQRYPGSSVEDYTWEEA